MSAWASFLSGARLQDPKPLTTEEQRTVFQRDHDRIVFSSPFRRLQDKTQVHPRSDSDYVRRRLTHSLEVSSVARSLGTFVGQNLTTLGASLQERQRELAFEIGQITAAAALAHDIGNPPFGHVGEKAIASWFIRHRGIPFLSDLSEVQRQDFEAFEGNAQGFRILTRTAHDGLGLRLTAATLGAFTKYPTGSNSVSSSYVGSKKYGFFQADEAAFANLARTLRLVGRGAASWSRHPLAFLVEAADDICYRIIDVEDGVKLQRISFDDAADCLKQMLPEGVQFNASSGSMEGNVGWLRANAIGGLIRAVQDVFLSNESSIIEGRFDTPLLDHVPMKGAIKEAKNLVTQNVFNWDRTLTAEIAGAKLVDTLLTDFIEAAASPALGVNEKILHMIPGCASAESKYEKLLSITDYISGMTDSFLLRLYRQLHGYSLLA